MKTIFIRFTFLVAVFIFNVVCLFGQNYKTVHFDREAYFESEEFGMGSPCWPCRFGIRTQEVVNDSTQYVFPTYWDTESGLGQPRFSWMGDTLQFLPDGTELFRNKNEDTITIKPQLETGERWVMFHLGNDEYLEATVMEKAFVEIFGVMDSVKTIYIQAKDSLAENIDHEMNDFSFQIGKNIGFIEAFDIYHFPKRMKKINLIGMSNPIIGEELLNAKSIYDFQVGDERLYIDDADYMNATYKRITVLEREDINPDSVRYLVKTYRLEFVTTYNNDTGYFDTEFNQSEGEAYHSYNVAEDHYLNIHPYELDSDPSGTLYNYYNFIGKTTDGKWFKSFYTELASLSSNRGQTYQACLGHTNLFYRESFEVQYRERLIYYKKGNTEWGTDVDLTTFTATEEVQNPKSTILIYPNPTKDNITISSKDPDQKLQHIQVLNALGQKVADWPCTDQEELTKSVVDFPIGTYWLLVTDEDGEVWRMSFVKG